MLGDCVDELVSNDALQLSDVPSGGDSVDLCAFAHTVDGYAELGEGDAGWAFAAVCRSRFDATGEVPWSLTTLRCALFLEYRSYRFTWGAPDDRDRVYLAALAAAIRERLRTGRRSGVPGAAERATSRLEALRRFREAASHCTDCRSAGLVHKTDDGEWARPLFHLEGTGSSDVLCVFEAPNYSDTYDPDKRRMTCNPGTDPSGQFTYELLNHIGLVPEEVVFTNAVLCLPAANDGRYPVRAAQESACSQWLRGLIEAVDPLAIVTFGGAALRAIGRAHNERLVLSEAAGRLSASGTRLILPLYHPSALGRVTRSASQQLADIEALKGPLRVWHA
jgi:uracil-DNA glycosylase family 4